MKAIFPLLLLFLFMSPGAKAAVVLVNADEVVAKEERISRKAEPKTKFWQKKLAKWTKTKEKKQRKNKFGRIGLFVLLAGVVSLFLFDPLFLLSLLIATIYGTIGLVKDERKTAAILSVAIPAGFILLVLILVGANWSE